MSQFSFNLIEGLLYRAPLRLLEAFGDPLQHRRSWDLGYHHAKRGKDPEPDNPAVADREAYIAGYELRRRETIGTGKGEAGPLPGPPKLSSPMGQDWRAQLRQSFADYERKKAEREEIEREERGQLSPGAQRLIDNGLVPGANRASAERDYRYRDSRHTYSDQRRAQMAAGRSIIADNERLSADWAEAEQALEQYNAFKAKGRAVPSEVEAKAKSRATRAVFGLQTALRFAAHDDPMGDDRETVHEGRARFVDSFMGKVAVGTVASKGTIKIRDIKLRKLPGKKGALHWRDDQEVRAYLGSVFDMWGPVAEGAFRKLKRILKLPPDVRGHYSPGNQTIVFDSVDDLAHELGHRIEDYISQGKDLDSSNLWANPTPMKKESYWAHRVAERAESEPLPLSQLTGRTVYEEMDEKAVKDKWAHPYMGKVYSNTRHGSLDVIRSKMNPDYQLGPPRTVVFGSTEIVSMLNEGFAHLGRSGYSDRDLARWRDQFLEDRSLLVDFAGYVSLAVKGASAAAKQEAARKKISKASPRRRKKGPTFIEPIRVTPTEPGTVSHGVRVSHPEHGEGVVTFAKEGFPSVKVNFGGNQVKVPRDDLTVLDQ